MIGRSAEMLSWHVWRQNRRSSSLGVNEVSALSKVPALAMKLQGWRQPGRRAGEPPRRKNLQHNGLSLW